MTSPEGYLRPVVTVFIWTSRIETPRFPWGSNCLLIRQIRGGDIEKGRFNSSMIIFRVLVSEIVFSQLFVLSSGQTAQ